MGYSNVFFHNQEGEYFKTAQEEFGLVNHLKSGASTYIDIENDGDLDIITMAYHGYVDVYINNDNENNSITFEFKDNKGNNFGVGTS